MTQAPPRGFSIIGPTIAFGAFLCMCGAALGGAYAIQELAPIAIEVAKPYIEGLAYR